MFSKIAASTLLAASALGGVGLTTFGGAATASAAQSGCRPASGFVTYPALWEGQKPARQPSQETRLNGAGCESRQLHGSVANVQRRLHIRADGVFGSGTRVAVIRFQRAHHLAADGVVGSATLRALHLAFIGA